MLGALFSKHGVLGINARNLLYVKPFNPRKATALADDKLKTKAYLTARGIPAARIYARIETREQLRAFDFSKLPDECVLKPNYGFGGEGIIIFRGRKNGDFVRTDGSTITRQDLVGHIEDILDGKFSLGGRLDTAFFEQIMKPHSCFAPFRPAGLPDIRVIVFNLVPVMAMLRVPTAESEGKANIHLGGIGLGIDIAKGLTTHAAQYYHRLTELPHGGSPSGIQIPFWDEILLICSRIQQITNIGYLAVDITIDEEIGPAVLEVNARAGLNVQIANLAPLRSRLQRVQGLSVSSPEKGVRIGQDLFGEKVQVTERADGKKPMVLGLAESITIIGAGASFDEPALIQPDKEESAFAADLLASLNENGAAEPEGNSGTHFRVKFLLGGQKRQTVVTGFFTKPGEPRVRLGRRDITGFLIDPTLRQKKPAQSTVRSDLRAVERQLLQLDRDFLVLKELKPINLAEERVRLAEDKWYQPLFQYRELDLDDARRRLEEPVRDESPLGILLEKKRQELRLRLDLLEARGQSARFTRASAALFGRPTAALLRAAETMLRDRPECDLPDPTKQFLSAEETKEKFMEVLRRYGLHNWTVEIRPTLIADCTVGGHSIYLRSETRFSPTRIEALVIHEIETHILTAENGANQPYELLQRGTAGYLETQEGLATYNQNRVYGPGNDRRYNPARNVLATAYGLTHSFAETRAYCEKELGYDEDKALTQTISIKRGLRDASEPGGFTKSLIYFRGCEAIEHFVNKGGDMRRLYIGKVTLQDLDLIEKIPDLQPPLLLPEFLREKKGDNKKAPTPKS